MLARPHLARTVRPVRTVSVSVPRRLANGRRGPPKRAVMARVWRRPNDVIGSLRNVSLSSALQREFEKHVAEIVAEIAQGELEDLAAGVASRCVSLVPLVGRVPLLDVLSRELVKRVVRESRAKPLVKQLVSACGPRHASIVMALSVATFMLQLARQWGSPLSLDVVIDILLEHAPLIAGFVAGKHVDLSPIINKLVPMRNAARNKNRRA
jgi:hypothetical protein